MTTVVSTSVIQFNAVFGAHRNKVLLVLAQHAKPKSNEASRHVKEREREREREKDSDFFKIDDV